MKDILRVQIDAGLVPVQAALAQGWDAPPSGIPALSEPSLQRGLPSSGCEELAGHTADTGKEPAPDACPTTATSSMSSLLAALHAFEQSPDYQRAPQAVQTLTQALSQQLRIALRDALPATQFHATVQPQSKEEGARNHV